MLKVLTILVYVSLLLKQDLEHVVLAIPPRTIIHWDHSSC
jgi:hypothetical protein